jgi:hypothetical protein
MKALLILLLLLGGCAAAKMQPNQIIRLECIERLLDKNLKAEGAVQGCAWAFERQ